MYSSPGVPQSRAKYLKTPKRGFFISGKNAVIFIQILRLKFGQNLLILIQNLRLSFVRDPGIEPGTFRVSVECSKPAELIARDFCFFVSKAINTQKGKNRFADVSYRNTRSRHNLLLVKFGSELANSDQNHI